MPHIAVLLGHIQIGSDTRSRQRWAMRDWADARIRRLARKLEELGGDEERAAWVDQVGASEDALDAWVDGDEAQVGGAA